MSYQPSLGAMDVDIMTLATKIEDRRKNGWGDATITSSLQSSESPQKIAAAFEYLRSKTFPTGTTFVPKAPVITVAKPSSNNPPWVPIVIGAGILGVLLLWRK